MKKILIMLNDQGGGCMAWNYEELADTLRAQTHGHLPMIVITDEDEETKRWISRPKFIGSEKRRMGSGNVSNIKRHGNSVSSDL